MISTSFMAGTGLKKCIPRNFSGRCDAAASSVMLKEEVLETKNRLGLDDGGHFGEGFLLQRHVLHHGLKDDVHVLQVLQLDGGLQVAPASRRPAPG